MQKHIFTTLVLALSLVSSLAFADARSLGKEYRTLLSNYIMVSDIGQRCPKLQTPSLEPRSNIEKDFREKIGIQNYNKVMHQIHKSSLRADALKTIDSLWETIDGCEDPKLAEVLNRINTVHTETHTRFKQELPLVEQKPIPIPLRK